MKIKDIIIIENLEEEIIDEYSSHPSTLKTVLMKKGYEFLGAGVDQQAYLEPSTGQVLKIFGTNDDTHGSGGLELSSSQKMFVYWSDYCKRNKKNPFLPKYSGWAKFEYDEHTFLQIRMEKLNDIGFIGDDLADISDAIARGNMPRATVYNDLITNGDELFFGNHINSIEPVVKLLGPKGFKLFAETIWDIARMTENEGFDLDLHGGNFMRRDDGTPVIVDPWVVS